ncbi:MAG: hypothetical protein U0169_08405 [Polyangiaceae bacterium]
MFDDHQRDHEPDDGRDDAEKVRGPTLAHEDAATRDDERQSGEIGALEAVEPRTEEREHDAREEEHGEVDGARQHDRRTPEAIDDDEPRERERGTEDPHEEEVDERRLRAHAARERVQGEDAEPEQDSQTESALEANEAGCRTRWPRAPVHAARGRRSPWVVRPRVSGGTRLARARPNIGRSRVAESRIAPATRGARSALQGVNVSFETSG